MSNNPNTINGQKLAFNGLDMEARIANAFSHYQNIMLLRKEPNSVGLEYENVFLPIAQKIGLLNNIESINNISATTDIALLPSGGSPKTDVLVTITYGSSNVLNKAITLSVKRTSQKLVSAHQYSAEAFISVLKIPTDSLLAKLLKQFQSDGGIKALKEHLGDNVVDEFTNQLKPYVYALTQWVVSGKGGPSDNNAIPDYIVTYSDDDHSLSIHTADEYCKMLLKMEPHQFGTPFSWTYASGERGKSIQLKMPVIK